MLIVTLGIKSDYLGNKYLSANEKSKVCLDKT